MQRYICDCKCETEVDNTAVTNDYFHCSSLMINLLMIFLIHPVIVFFIKCENVLKNGPNLYSHSKTYIMISKDIPFTKMYDNEKHQKLMFGS